jgi:hypothetical protein
MIRQGMPILLAVGLQPMGPRGWSALYLLRNARAGLSVGRLWPRSGRDQRAELEIERMGGAG